MPLGLCKLCKEEKELQRSHYIPSGVYRLFKGSGKRSNPLVITRRYVVQTTEQMTDFLLCSRCEQLLNIRGEKWTLARMARRDGFRLRQSVLKCPYGGNDETRFYITCGAKDIDHEKLVHLALSVFWRGAVKVWTRSGDTTDPLDLGPFEEPIRLFLLGKAPYPTDIAVIASLWPFEQILTGIYHPRHARPDEALGFCDLFFYIPGMSFNLIARENLSPASRHLCMYSGPRRLMFMSEPGALALAKLHNFHLSKPMRMKGR
jgi:hypothetical protein